MLDKEIQKLLITKGRDLCTVIVRTILITMISNPIRT